MDCIQNSFIGTPSPFNKAIAGLTGVVAITEIALSIIKPTAITSGPFNAIVQFDTTTNGILLGASIFVLILDLVWIVALCKKTKASFFSLSDEQEPLQSVLVEEINNTDSFSQQPKEIFFKVFSYLSAIEQAKCGEVSRRWRKFAFDETLLAAFNPRNLSPLLKVFDESDWITYVDLSAYGLTTEDIPPRDVRKETTLLEKVLSSQLMTEIEGDAGFTLLTIPKGLTFNTLVKLAPKEGNIPKFRSIWDRISSEIGDIPVDKTYRIVITNNIFKWSRSEHLSENDVDAFLSEIGCEKPKVLEAAVLLVVTFMSSGERLYIHNPSPYTQNLFGIYYDNRSSYTRCLERISTSWFETDGDQLFVGGFSPDGIVVNRHDFFDPSLAPSGVGGVLLKFCSDSRRVEGAVRTAPPTDRSVQISRTTLFKI